MIYSGIHIEVLPSRQVDTCCAEDITLKGICQWHMLIYVRLPPVTPSAAPKWYGLRIDYYYYYQQHLQRAT
jgi:hypothetical protein